MRISDWSSDVCSSDLPARHVAHEIAHAWWMLASPLTDDFWLVESAAEYMSMRYVEHAFGPEELAKNIAEKRKATVDVGPVMGHGRPNRPQPYGKGTLLLVEPEKRLGRPGTGRASGGDRGGETG